jgi:N-methylhydantoinase A
MSTPRVLIAVDTGGTFTDAVAVARAHTHVTKIPSTPADPARAVVDAIRAVLVQAGLDAAESFDLLIHGSTVATNALLERQLARVVLITNRGFEDVLAIGRQNRPQLYALTGSRPAVLVPAERRLGIAGRIDVRGAELDPLDAAELSGLAERVQRAGAESVAVCLLHSYANPTHEAAVGAALAALALPCTLSSELLPEYREYERATTTVVNACVAPLMAGYLARIESESGAARVRIMGSGGGALAVSRARRDAAHTILSGPAGGVMGALHVAARHGISDIMTFDMGGTSTDVSLCPGRALHTREFGIAGVPVALPVLDIHTVGAGGGSIAFVDSGGALHVGPRSAGSVPGPICYGRGGTQVTVTDANVALGRLFAWPDGLQLDAAAVAAPLDRLARDAGCSPIEAADGVIRVVNTAMEGALRVISVERGHDPVDFTLVPFGGAAGLHAVALAERLGIPRLLVPPDPGVLSAFGMLFAPVRKDAARTVLLSEPSDAEIEPLFVELEAAALQAMQEESVPADGLTLRRRVAARYAGQSHELVVPAAHWRDRFHADHERRFGYARADAAVEAVTLRVEALSPAAPLPPPELRRAASAPVQEGSCSVMFEGDVVTAARYARLALLAGHVIAGPAVVLERTAAFWLPPGWSAAVAGDGTLVVEQ